MAILFAIRILTYDLPIYCHSLFIDYPDPERPGHLKGVIVRLPELLLTTSIPIALALLAILLQKRLKQSSAKTFEERS